MVDTLSWRTTVTYLLPKEVEFCEKKLLQEIWRLGVGGVVVMRAARLNDTIQLKRFHLSEAIEGIINHTFVAKRWDWRRFRFVYYLLGFGYNPELNKHIGWNHDVDI